MHAVKATPKQISYIIRLSSRLGYKVEIKDLPKSRAEGSEMIKRLLEQEGQESSIKNESPDKFNDT